MNINLVSSNEVLSVDFVILWKVNPKTIRDILEIQPSLTRRTGQYLIYLPLTPLSNLDRSRKATS